VACRQKPHFKSPFQGKTHKSERGASLSKTLTFGAGTLAGYDPRRGEMIELSCDQRKTIYKGLIDGSKAFGALCNCISSREYANRVLDVPKEHAAAFSTTTYKAIRERVENAEILSANVLSQTYGVGRSQFAGERGKDLMGRGRATLATFKTDGTFPIKCKGSSTRLVEADGAFWFVTQVFSGAWTEANGVPAWVALQLRVKPRDRSGAEQLGRLVSKEWELRGGEIARNPRDNGRKWLVRLAVCFEPAPVALDAETIMGIDLGINSPATIHIRQGGKPFPWACRVVGHGRNLMAARGAVKGEIKRILRALGRKDSPLDAKTKTTLRERLRDFRQRERRTLKTGAQQIAARVAIYAKEHGAGTWQMEDLELSDLKEGKPWLVGRWAVGEWIKAIEWQAAQLGATIVKVDPRKTSQRCHKCGHIARENRPKKDGADRFQCVACGHKDDADKNAARNLSMPGIDRVIRETMGVTHAI
jgi:hypothetical protein